MIFLSVITEYVYLAFPVKFSRSLKKLRPNAFSATVENEKKRIHEKGLQISNLCKNYFRKTAVNDVTFGIDEKQFLGLVGENGAGKTTIIKCILNLIKPS